MTTAKTAEAAKPVGGKLHGVSMSPFVRKVRAVLAIKEIDYELVNVMPGAGGPEFHAISPLGKVPVWEEDGWSLPDSSVIAAYLERCVPTPAIFPDDPRAYAADLFWEEYTDTRLVDAGSPIFFQRIVRAKIFKEAPDETLVRRNLEEVLPMVLDQLESLFIERHGADPVQLTLGNLSVWSAFVNLSHADFEVDASAWPGLAGFLEAIGEHSVLRSLVEEERAALATF
jgi:glutathione S-transferase